MFEDLAVDDERLLPQHGGVEGPAVAEAIAFRPAHQAHDLGRGRVGLQDESEVHARTSKFVSVRVVSGLQPRYWQVERGTNVPWPARPVYVPRSTTTSPRDMTVSTRPVTVLPS